MFSWARSVGIRQRNDAERMLPMLLSYVSVMESARFCLGDQTHNLAANSLPRWPIVANLSLGFRPTENIPEIM
jgi:hypothetical protein